MSDDLTPPFEEPVGSSPDDQDELVDGAAEEVDFFVLNNWIDGTAHLLGFTGMLKAIREDGSLVAFHVGFGINHYEAIGLHRKALQVIEEDAEMDSYWEED
jgi:hypothetical protein